MKLVLQPSGTSRLRLIPQIFAVFCKIGPSTFGGGYAMIATIEKEIVDRKGWMDKSEMGDMISVAGSAPGGVAVNAAAFIGYRLGGVIGALAAVTGITLPTLVVVLLLSLTYALFKDNPKVEAALKGVHAAVVALILVAAWKMARSSLFDVATYTLAAAALAILLFTNLHSIWLILGGPAIGAAVVAIRRLKRPDVRTEPGTQELDSSAMMPEYYI
ncbi:chromate transporter [Saccharibacillus sp. CPCC 101409]|uniref:chromate transporter n=1 Tax=Saccharibacillus sp. CPCC 101409 TaxID=3058041 RepID=UPI0026721EE9|nr:chromate transporter [Saccharibacillus sp. CPCC 101409]MDO3409108.1 chromate transporter [Saccharibacillus sp. CPCC 101409]